MPSNIRATTRVIIDNLTHLTAADRETIGQRLGVTAELLQKKANIIVEQLAASLLGSMGSLAAGGMFGTGFYLFLRGMNTFESLGNYIDLNGWSGNSIDRNYCLQLELAMARERMTLDEVLESIEAVNTEIRNDTKALDNGIATAFGALGFAGGSLLSHIPAVHNCFGFFSSVLPTARVPVVYGVVHGALSAIGFGAGAEIVKCRTAPHP